jgi:uncharacterized protein
MVTVSVSPAVSANTATIFRFLIHTCRDQLETKPPYSKEFSMPALNVLALILLIVGGLNWGLVGLFNFDLVAALFGGTVGDKSNLSRIVYGLVGLAALYGFVLIAPLTNPTVSDIRDADRRPRI